MYYARFLISIFFTLSAGFSAVAQQSLERPAQICDCDGTCEEAVFALTSDIIGQTENSIRLITPPETDLLERGAELTTPELTCPSPLNLGQIDLSDFGGSGRIEDGSEAVFGRGRSAVVTGD